MTVTVLCALGNFYQPLDKVLELWYYKQAPSNWTEPWRVWSRPL